MAANRCMALKSDHTTHFRTWRHLSHTLSFLVSDSKRFKGQSTGRWGRPVSKNMCLQPSARAQRFCVDFVNLCLCRKLPLERWIYMDLGFREWSGSFEVWGWCWLMLVLIFSWANLMLTGFSTALKDIVSVFFELRVFIFSFINTCF